MAFFCHEEDFEEQADSLWVTVIVDIIFFWLIIFSQSLGHKRICLHLILKLFAAIDVLVIGINLVICSQGCIPKKISMVALHGV